MDEAKFANDFEERHGWSPDIGYEVIEPKPKKKKKEPKLTPKQEKFVVEYIKKLENKDIPVHPGELENSKDSLDKATQLRNVFCVALADIRDSWGKKDEPSKD